MASSAIGVVRAAAMISPGCTRATITLTMPPEAAASIHAVASSLDSSTAELIRSALTEYVRSRRLDLDALHVNTIIDRLGAVRCGRVQHLLRRSGCMRRLGGGRGRHVLCLPL